MIIGFIINLIMIFIYLWMIEIEVIIYFQFLGVGLHFYQLLMEITYIKFYTVYINILSIFRVA